MIDLDPRHLLKAIPIVALFLLGYIVGTWMLWTGLKWTWKGEARRTPKGKLYTGTEAVVGGVQRMILAVVLLVMLTYTLVGSLR